MTSTYLNYKIYANNMAQTLQRTASQSVVSRDTSYYEQNIGKVKSVSDFVNNYRLFSYAMQASGLQDMTYAKAFMTKVLNSDLSDSRSFVNTLTDPRYKAFAQAFSFTSSGNVADTSATQSTDQEDDTLDLYSKASTASSTAVSSAETYYKANIGSVKSVADLVGDSQLMNVVMTAYGLSTSTTSTADIEAALESDVSDPKSAANTSGNPGLKKLAADFNFASDGTTTNQRLAQSQANFATMAAAYTAQAGTDSTSQAAAKTESTYVADAIEKATSLSDITSDSRVVAYIGKAFGVSGLTAGQLGQVLESDPNDLKSYADNHGDSYRQIAASFNFNATGTIARQPAQQAQTKANTSQTVINYLNQQIQTEAGQQSPGAKLALYFEQKAPSLTNVYQILADSSLLKVAQTALGIPSSSSQADIEVQAKAISSRLKLSDLRDPAKLDKFLSQFAALYDVNNASSTTDPTSPVNLLRSSSDSSSADSILSLYQSTPSSSSILSLFSNASSSDDSTSAVSRLFS